MKAALRLFTIVVLALATTVQADAQKVNYTTGGGMIIGFGAGASYQGSDIANSMGVGFDFTLGSYLYKRDDAFLSIDWKFRFLAGENIAFDHRINPDDTYSNLQYKFFDYDLELGLTLNRLRERSRIIVSGFAGVGLTHGRTFTDLVDGDGNPYDFTAIDPTKPRSEVRADLLALSDNDFEEAITSKGAIMPTAGLFIGYQFSRNFSMGIEHKINFSLKEYDGTFGINIDNNPVTGSPIDMNHYTSLGFRWTLGGRTKRSSNSNTYREIEKSPVVYNNADITIPADTVRPGRTYYGNNRRRPAATITTVPVTASRPVTTTIPVTTNPPVTNTQVTTTAPVTRTNTVRTTRPTTTIPVEPTQPKELLPTIVFVNPSSPATVGKNVFALRALTTNISKWQDVTITVNGYNNTNFSLTPEGVITLTIALDEGINSVEVSGKNSSGVVKEKTSITYQKPAIKVADPVVTPPVTVPPVTTPPVTTPPVTTPPVTVPPVTTPPVTEPAGGTAQTQCGVRINPGNSAWQFCLVTPSGTYTRENLTNQQFSYSGAASALYMMPIAGGGDAVIKGRPYKMKPGQYYLFTGSITVTVSTRNPGSMGQWSVCITSDREPVTGNGNNRPKSPCEK